MNSQNMAKQRKNVQKANPLTELNSPFDPTKHTPQFWKKKNQRLKLGAQTHKRRWGFREATTGWPVVRHQKNNESELTRDQN